MIKILIFGTGSVAGVLLKRLDLKKTEIVGFIHSDKEVKKFCGYSVIRPGQIKDSTYDYIVIASGYYYKMRDILLQEGVSESRIIGYIFDEAEFYQNTEKTMKQIIDKETNREKMREILTDADLLLPQIYPAVFWKNNAVQDVYKDFVREQNTALIAQEIRRKAVEGQVAELGVFKGDFTVILDKLFSERKVYLFDTFCGFDIFQVGNDEKVENKENEIRKFKDTSAEYVLSRLMNKTNKYIVKQGVFPNTFDIPEERFCFVSIDLNIKEPVYESLEIFYPRLSEGGYILVSDFNAPFYDGSREAVLEFSEKYGVSYLPIPDLYGSVIIGK